MESPEEAEPQWLAGVVPAVTGEYVNFSYQLSPRMFRGFIGSKERKRRMEMNFPKDFVFVFPSPREIVARLGLTERVRFEGTGPGLRKESQYTGSSLLPSSAWGSSRSSKYEDEYVTVEVPYWFSRESDRIVMFANITAEILLGDERRDVPGVIEQLAPPATVQVVRDWVHGLLHAQSEEYNEQLLQWLKELFRNPVSSCLSPEMTRRLDEMGRGIFRPSQLVIDFVREWAEAEVLYERQGRGEILVNFGGHFRMSGATGQAKYWVIRPDGTEYEPDETTCRKHHPSEGEKCWRLVEAGELAISWFKANTGSNHEFVVNFSPIDLTIDQLATVARLEIEIGARFGGTIGMSGKESPDIGDGWGFWGHSTLDELGQSESEKELVLEDPAANPLSADEVVGAAHELKNLFG